MKRALKAMEAMMAIIEAQVPERTATYTPLAHGDMMFLIREHLGQNGFMIEKEDYTSSQNGDVGLVIFTINYGDDPDIELVAAFLNSYNKQFKFRFGMGAVCKITKSLMFTGVHSSALFRRKHNGEADLDVQAAVSDTVMHTGDFWELLIKSKDQMMNALISPAERNQLLGELYFVDEVLNSAQATALREELHKPLHNWCNFHEDNAWKLYNQICQILQESHPTFFLTHHEIVHEKVMALVNKGSVATSFNASTFDDVFSEEDADHDAGLHLASSASVTEFA